MTLSIKYRLTAKAKREALMNDALEAVEVLRLLEASVNATIAIHEQNGALLATLNGVSEDFNDILKQWHTTEAINNKLQSLILRVKDISNLAGDIEKSLMLSKNLAEEAAKQVEQHIVRKVSLQT